MEAFNELNTNDKVTYTADENKPSKTVDFVPCTSM